MTEAEDKDVSEMKTLILSPGVACVSAEMQVQVPGCGLSDPSTNGWQAKTFMGGNPVTAIETPELTIHFQQINRFAQTLLANRGHQSFHLVFVEKSLQRSADGSQRHLVHPHERTLVKQQIN